MQILLVKMRQFI